MINHSLEDQLKRWKKIAKAMEEIPGTWQSQYFQNFKTEVNQRIDGLREDIRFVCDSEYLKNIEGKDV
jgi:hypothetical protein